MYRRTLLISVVVLVALAGYLLWPSIRGAMSPGADLEKADVTYRAFLAEQWRVALGSHPDGNKQKAGDGRTPVGEYKICTRDKRSRHHLFLGLDFPNRKDADRMLGEGLVSERRHQEIYSRVNQGLLPPQDTPLGGGMGIHGGGTSRDWTGGSIALDDDVIEILWGACPNGTPVVIYENFTDWELNPLMPSYK
jgi:murein L,D-transpeptidase YafK